METALAPASAAPPSAICVASHHSTIHALLEDPEFRGLAGRDGFYVELRLDYYDDLTNASLAQALKVFGPRVIATFRHPAEGGRRQGVSDEFRLAFLQEAADLGAEYIDIEARTERTGFRKNGAKLMLSYHDFQNAPGYNVLLSIWRRMRRQDGVDIVKIAVAPHTVIDTLPLLDLFMNEGGKNTVLLAMGEAGVWTRVLGGKFGAPFTYARGENAPGTAPGQLSWRQLLEKYRYPQIDPSTPVYGVIGSPIGHSLSPLMHNAALIHLGLPGVYLPFKVECAPALFMREFTRLGLRGLSVTIPHKVDVMSECAEVEPAARAIGAVNTLTWDGSRWTGSNTDAPAAADALQTRLPSLHGKNVLVLGAGGAARAVVFGVKERGAHVYVLNRNAARAEAMAKELGATALGVGALAALKIDAIVNTTPVGMYPEVDFSPLEESQLPPGGLVFDTVYNPLRTRLLDLAERRGCATIPGLAMFVHQGARQFELWTGKTAPRELMERVVLEELKRRNANPQHSSALMNAVQSKTRESTLVK